MKNKIILTLAFLAVLIGCQDDAYEAPNSFSDVGFYTGLGQQRTLQLNLNDYLTFSDLSQGYMDHSWSIDQGNNFLEGPINSRDSIFDKKIIYPGDTMTKDKSVHVLFKKSGFQKVRLRNVFKDSVGFRGWDGTKSYVKPAVKEGNVWVIDTTFIVKVFDTIVPEIEVRQFGAVVNHNSTDTIYVEAGDKIQFIDKTTIGEPTGRYWSIRKTLPAGAVATPSDIVASSTLQTADIVFKKLGHFTAIVTVNRTGQNLPGDSDKLVITSPIKVIPSSQPFVVFANPKELENETIQIPFNGEFAPFVGKESFFKVTVNGVDFPIKTVSINTIDSTILDIVLAGSIYRPDVIKVSLKSGSGLESTDTRKPVVFTDLPVTMHRVNLLNSAIAGFEDGGTGWTEQAGLNNGAFSYSTAQAATGNSSLKIDLTGKTVGFVRALNAKFSLAANTTYIFTFKMWVDPSKPKPNSVDLWIFPNWKQLWIGTSAIETGKWVTLTAEYKTGAGAELDRYLGYRILTTNSVVYLDDFYIENKEVRP